MHVLKALSIYPHITVWHIHLHLIHTLREGEGGTYLPEISDLNNIVLKILII